MGLNPRGLAELEVYEDYKWIQVPRSALRPFSSVGGWQADWWGPIPTRGPAGSGYEGYDFGAMWSDVSPMSPMEERMEITFGKGFMDQIVSSVEPCFFGGVRGGRAAESFGSFGSGRARGGPRIWGQGFPRGEHKGPAKQPFPACFRAETGHGVRLRS